MQIFDSYIEAGQDECLSQREKERYYTALIEYLAYGIEPKLSGNARMTFTAIKPTLNTTRQRSESGKKGGSKTQAKDNFASDESDEAKDDFACVETVEANGGFACDEGEEANSKGKGNKKDTPKGVSKKSPGFVKPTIEEIRSYASEKGYPGFDAERFWNFYESKGWMVGKNHMTRWKSAVCNWLSDEKPRGGGFHDEYSDL